MSIRMLLLVAGCALAVGAWAQVRSIPEDAKRGEMRHLQDMVVEINGVQQRLAPGARIRDAANRTLVPTALSPASPVKYQLDAQGMVREVWILTPAEAAKP